MTAVPQTVPDDDLIISLRGISKGFGAVQALDDVSLDIYKGEVVAIVGDNGAGKWPPAKILVAVHAAYPATFRYQSLRATTSSPASPRNLGRATSCHALPFGAP